MALSRTPGVTPHLTRRTVLTGAAAFLAGTAGLPGAARAAAAPRVRAAATGWAGRGGELLVLTVGPAAEADYAIRLLDPAGPATAGRAVEAALGPPLPIRLPPGFHPHSMAATGAVLWLTGATATAPDRSRPALLRIENGETAYADLPVPEGIRSGVATAVAPRGGGLAVAIEGSGDEHLAAISRAHLAVSADAGRTWTGTDLATGLGEGYGTVLAETGDGLFAAVADGEGTQTVYAARTAALEPAATLARAGRPMAAVATGSQVRLFSDRDGTVTETRFSADGRLLGTAEAAPVDCGCEGVVAVPGGRGVWLETAGGAVRIRS